MSGSGGGAVVSQPARPQSLRRSLAQPGPRAPPAAERAAPAGGLARRERLPRPPPPPGPHAISCLVSRSGTPSATTATTRIVGCRSASMLLSKALR